MDIKQRLCGNNSKRRKLQELERRKKDGSRRQKMNKYVYTLKNNATSNTILDFRWLSETDL